MPIVRSRIRESSLCSSILFFISILAVFVLYINKRIFTQVLDFKDPLSMLLLYFGVVTIIFLTSILYVLLLFGFEYLQSVENLSIIERFRNHLINHEYLCYLMCVDLACFMLCFYMELELHLDYFFVIISASILFTCTITLADYDDVDLYSSQNMEKSIGAFWAHGAFYAFYKKILVDITIRMSDFEEKYGITLLVKKLVMICPLSCNASGSLEGKCGNIVYEGTPKPIVDDDGANNNRCLKTTVYKIHGPFEYYITAEIPSPLAVLYEMKDVMDPLISEYHRKCFVETLQDLLRSYPCIILEYDDLNSPEPLHSFLLSKLDDNQKKSV